MVEFYNLNVLLLDDDKNIHKSISKYMDIFGNTLGMNFFYSNSLKSSKEILERYHIDYIVSDFLIHENTILDLIDWIGTKKMLIPIDCLTSIRDVDLIEKLHKLGVKHIMYKPISIYNFIQIVYQNIKKIKLKYKEVSNEL